MVVTTTAYNKLTLMKSINLQSALLVSRLPYKFDPRVGIIIEDLKGFPNQTQIEEITCLNNFNRYNRLTFEPEISLRKPLIENHNRSDYLVGEEIALELLNIRELKGFVNKNLSTCTLLIKNASLSDSGQYVCTISVLNLFESNVKNIEVKDNIVQFVKFKDKNDSMVNKKIVNEGDDFLWEMQFEGYPRNLIYTFYNPYGELFLHKDKRANASYVYEEGKLSLSIKRVTAEDFGNYSARLEAPNGNYDENYVMLVVNGKDFNTFICKDKGMIHYLIVTFKCSKKIYLNSKYLIPKILVKTMMKFNLKHLKKIIFNCKYFNQKF
ncbi:hypothetical protein Avbf_02832 [Armadillidium vulgare]|nr:hypothetical protein Avbf_02832 [Armadillidium vulgare]